MNRLTDEERDLAAAHYDFARKIANRMQAGKPPGVAAEIESAALLGLCAAAAKFDPARGVTFRTYAGHVVRGAVLDMLRAETPRGYKSPAGRKKILPKVRSTSAVLAHAIDNGELPVGWELDSADAVDGMIAKAPRHTREAVRLYFLGGKRMKDVGRTLGVCESRASQMVTAALKELAERGVGR